MSTTAILDPIALRGEIRGATIARGEPGYDEQRAAFNVLVDLSPDLIAIPVDADDVAAIVRYAAAAGLRVTAQRTGHNAAPYGDLSGTVLVKTHLLQGVEIDVAAQRARVGAGTVWGDIVPTLSELGLAALHGSSPDIGIVGYSLGGGLGWYGRKHGLATNSVTAIELVTAEGDQVRVDDDNDPELFWALRGGGGSFGIVTAIEFALYAISEVYAGALFFPWERTSEVLHAWHELTATAPDELTTVGRILQFPPLPMVPEPLRGKAFVIVEAFFLGTAEEGARLLEPIRRLGPAMDTVAMTPPVGLAEIHMDPRDPVPVVSTTAMLGELPSSAIDELVAVVGPASGSTLTSVELRHTGGELGRRRVGGGALASLPGSFAMFGVTFAPDRVAQQVGSAQLEELAAALAPYHAGHYMNFVEESTDAGEIFPGDVHARLREIKAEVDPENRFRANHPIEPAA